jgi:outer membrane immunogenic protein
VPEHGGLVHAEDLCGVGTGIEYAFLPNWSAKIEYDFIDFGKDNVNFTLANGGSLGVDSHQFLHAVKFGLNYRFGNLLGGAY